MRAVAGTSSFCAGDCTMSVRCAWISALKLARRGLRVFPCSADKRPLTINGFKDASADPDIIHSWFTEYPDALIGVPGGDRFVVIDIDLQHLDAQRWYDDNRSRLTLTRMHVTRSGGRHLLYLPTSQVGCSTGKLGPHVDTRGSGGYIIWWPACGLSALHGRALAPVPDWIIAALHPPPPPEPPNVVRLSPRIATHRQFEGIVRRVATAHPGERNTLCYWGACRMAELVAQNALGRADAIEIVIEAASRAGLPRNEARRTALSAFRTGA
jgi:bifunctional DNA primase/polymerase-like protein